MLIAHKWSIQGLPVDRRGEAFKGEEELAAVFAFEEIEVALAAVLFGEGDAGGGFGGGRNMSGAVGPGLYDMHHAASALGVPTDIERVCSHQNASHRFYSRIKFYFSHRRIENFIAASVDSTPQKTYCPVLMLLRSPSAKECF